MNTTEEQKRKVLRFIGYKVEEPEYEGDDFSLSVDGEFIFSSSLEDRCWGEAWDTKTPIEHAHEALEKTGESWASTKWRDIEGRPAQQRFHVYVFESDTIEPGQVSGYGATFAEAAFNAVCQWIDLQEKIA